MGRIIKNGIDYAGAISFPTAELLWSGDFIGVGTITVNGLSDWLLVGYCNYPGDDVFVYMSIGSPSRGGSMYGQYDGTGITQFAHRFKVIGDTITVSNENRGIYFENTTTYQSGANNHVYAIYGLVKKPIIQGE